MIGILIFYDLCELLISGKSERFRSELVQDFNLMLSEIESCVCLFCSILCSLNVYMDVDVL